MISPEIKRLLAFRQEFVALVDRSHSADRTADVVQDAIGHMGGNAKPRHARYDRAA